MFPLAKKVIDCRPYGRNKYSQYGVWTLKNIIAFACVWLRVLNGRRFLQTEVTKHQTVLLCTNKKHQRYERKNYLNAVCSAFIRLEVEYW